MAKKSMINREKRRAKLAIRRPKSNSLLASRIKGEATCRGQRPKNLLDVAGAYPRWRRVREF